MGKKFRNRTIFWSDGKHIVSLWCGFKNTNFKRVCVRFRESLTTLEIEVETEIEIENEIEIETEVETEVETENH